MTEKKRYGVYMEAEEAYWCTLQTDSLEEAVMEYNRKQDQGQTMDLVENVNLAGFHCLQRVNLV